MQLEELNIVAIGGGHGLGRVLRTLSFMGDKLTGIVTTTDNGGSTGRLRKRSSSIAWGDLRNCLTQLVDEDTIGSQLFNFRFNGDDELSGHNLGNLILYGLDQIQTRPIDSIDLVRRMLGVKTRLFPMSEHPTDLMAFYPKGRCRVGELSVDDMPIMPTDLILAPIVKTPHYVVDAIKSADIIILGPGSFLTSVIPPLLVRDIAKAIHSSKAHCVFIDNLAKEKSPAGNITLDEKLAWIKHNLKFQPIKSIITSDAAAHSTQVHVIKHSMFHPSIKHRHNNSKLLKALELVIDIIEQSQATEESLA